MASSSNGPERIKEALARHHRFLVTGHIDPDPDALGSVLALARMLQHLGKDAVAASPDPVPDMFQFLPGAGSILLPDQVEGPFDALVVVDCAPDRIGKLAPWRKRVGVVINIDHHGTNPRQEPLHWVEPEAAAVGEMVYKLSQVMGVPVDQQMATCLYAAIMTDTGSFRFSNTRAETFAIASDLVQRGADPAAIAGKIYEERPWSHLKLLALALATLDRSADGRVAWVSVTRKMMEEAGAGADELDGLVQFPRMARGVEVALLFRELPTGDTRVSFRSRTRVDVSRLAEELGGGGHARAAGAFVKAPLQEAIPLVLDRVREHLSAGAQ